MSLTKQHQTMESYNGDNSSEDDEDEEVPTLVEISDVDSPSPRLLVDDTVNDEKNDDTTIDRVQEKEEQEQEKVSDKTNTTSNNNIVPVTILSGFLGSGKTTLIQYILHSNNHGKRIAIIENEYGEGLNVESLIARDGDYRPKNDGDNNNGEESSSSLTDLIELPNGCICCTVKDTLVTTIESLLDKRSDLDYIIIEASGMANPGPIASVFWLDDALESKIILDGIITVVDSYHILSHLAETNEAAQQIAYADRILLNKVDLIEENDDGDEEKEDHCTKQSKSINNKLSKKDIILSTIKSIHPTVPIRCTKYSQIPDLNWILDTGCFSKNHPNKSNIINDSDLNFDVPNPSSSSTSTNNSDNNNKHKKCSSLSCIQCQNNERNQQLFLPSSLSSSSFTLQQHHTHTSDISTISLSKAGTVDLDLINKWFALILWPEQDEDNKVLQEALERHKNNNNSNSNNETQIDQRKEDKKQIITKKTMTLFRIKGILSVRPSSSIEDEEEEEEEGTSIQSTEDATSYVDKDNGYDKRRYIVQAVHDLWEVYPCLNDDLRWDRYKIDPSTTTREGKEEQILEERCCKIVLIGRHLKHKKLQEGFEACFI